MAENTKVLRIVSTDTIVGSRPIRWTDAQWEGLVTEIREYYGTDLVEEEWEL